MARYLKPKLTIALLFSILTTLCSALLIYHLIHTFIAYRTITPGDLTPWISRARSRIYGVCYNGCNDCLYVQSIENACRMTSRVEIEGIICDARHLWFWTDEAKYPSECLRAVAQILVNEEVERRRFWWNFLYVLMALSVVLGYLTFLAARWGLDRVDWRGLWARRPRPVVNIRRGNGRSNSPSSRTPLLAAAILALALPTAAMAYPCMNQPAHNQLFSNADNTIYGVIHGWLSSCYDETFSCGETCTTSSPSGNSRCDTVYCTQPRAAKSPRDFVVEAGESVKACGFRLVDHVPGVVDKRIPNPGIEGRLWVKVAVNRFNGTEGVVDRGVMCLYVMVER